MNLNRALTALAAAQRRLSNAMRENFPLGAEINWRYVRSGLQRGHVTAHSLEHPDQLKVKNQDTGSEYWIRLSAVVR